MLTVSQVADRVTEAIKRRLRQFAVRNSFSILSSNCWGAEVYRELRRPYLTPFVGLFLFPQCYLRFCAEPRLFLSPALDFAHSSRHLKTSPPSPLGVLGGQ